ncbi:hypothetical protein DPMN_031132 [Dreissena polymorpha]|uniref:Uncharacterized protein n=1 Tax=Dreissena polymorpha TaxID=45954 RepID=A0A9D4M1Q1_DREPO|nr:hypothetical protein DPMN_031132 [Dreissena polymorpha]
MDPLPADVGDQAACHVGRCPQFKRLKGTWYVRSGKELQGHQHANVLEYASATSVHLSQALMLDPSPQSTLPDSNGRRGPSCPGLEKLPKQRFRWLK